MRSNTHLKPRIDFAPRTQFMSNTSPRTLSLRDIAAWQFPLLCNPPIVVGLPSLQRGAVWNAGQIELLWDSIMRGFPIGALVVCPKLSDQGTRSGRHGGGWNEKDITHHLLDGQQRSNAIALAYVDALNAEDPSATLWIDLAPSLTQGSTRQFLLRVLTRAHPWGYRSSDDAAYLSVPAKRAALAKYSQTKRPAVTAAWPHEACTPIPFAWLIEASAEKFWPDVLAKCATANAHPWAAAAADMISDHLAQSKPHLQRIEDGLSLARGLRLVALEVPTEALQGRSAQEESDGSADSEQRIYNVEHLFQRLNSAGTELRGEELMFSMIKAYWPDIEKSFDAIHDKHGKSFLPMPGSRLATLGARAALMQSNVVPPALSIARIRSLAQNRNEERARIENYLGIDLAREGHAHESDLHQNLRLIDEWLLYDCSDGIGLPAALRATIAIRAPIVFLLLLHLAQRVRAECDSQRAAFRRPILGLATTLQWFGTDTDSVVEKIITALPNAMSPTVFTGILKPFFPTQMKIMSPDTLAAVIPVASADEGELNDWHHWSRISQGMNEQQQREFGESERAAWWKVLQSRELLLYAQRAYIAERFADYDPSCVDLREGQNRPWDFDHLLPNDVLSNNQGFRKACRAWGNTIANFRVAPLEDNRSRKDDQLNKSLITEVDLAHSFVRDQSACDAFSMTWHDLNDEGKVARFMNTARQRLIDIYNEWYVTLDIGSLL
jgi:hypothetical protein